MVVDQILLRDVRYEFVLCDDFIFNTQYGFLILRLK